MRDLMLFDLRQLRRIDAAVARLRTRPPAEQRRLGNLLRALESERTELLREAAVAWYLAGAMAPLAPLRAHRSAPQEKRDPAPDDSLRSATPVQDGTVQPLADPIVQALLLADRLGPEDLEELMGRVAARLQSRSGSLAGALPW
jgi:hypothetical protein